jgi:hypothetical protein
MPGHSELESVSRSRIGYNVSVLLFKLRFVPDDEVQDIRELLSENAIDYYETGAGILGFAMPAIWLRDESQLEYARKLIDDYQEQRATRARTEYNNRKLEGTNKTIIDLFKESPTRYLGYLLAIIFILYFTVILFFNLGN